MMRTLFVAVAALAILGIGCSQQPTPTTSPLATEAPDSARPAGVEIPADAASGPTTGPIEASPVDLRSLPRAIEEGWNEPEGSRDEPRRPDVPRMTDEEAAQMRADALLAPPNPSIPVTTLGVNSLTVEEDWESLNFGDNAGGAPPDPEMAAGPNHVIAAANSIFEVYDRDGTSLVGPTSFNTFFSGVSGCGSTFDPNALYDEKEDRFILGIDSAGTTYCVAVSQTNDPTGTWNRYSFNAQIDAGDFFDYPHAGVGENYMFMGSNNFGSPFKAPLWAIDKQAMYDGDPLPLPNSVVLAGADTPQPMNLHGFAQGTWPASATHYILTDQPFNGSSFGVWSWDGVAAAATLLGTVNLNLATGVTAVSPTNFPQQSGAQLQGNDFRVQDAEYRNGSIWTVNTIGCNPGGGTVNCIRWAEIDPAAVGGPEVVQAGVISSSGEYRQFADLAVNHCDDVLIGYTKSSTSMYPGVYYTGRLGTDAPGTTQPEVQLIAGSVEYTSFANDPPPHRWGDYTGATSDPDGTRLWYLGEYSSETGVSSKWTNRIGRFSTDCSASGIFADGFESGNTTAWSASFP